MIAALTYTFLVFMQFGLNSTELYTRGNAYYEQGKYSEAIVAYEQINKEVNNGRVYYNLGNSYFKRGMLGKAILNYRKANFLSPRDSDIAYNLNFARNYRVDKISSAQSPFVVLLSKLLHFVSLFEAQLLTTILFMVSVFFLSMLVVYRRKIAAYMLAAGIFICLFFFLNWLSWRAEIAGSPAVVVAAEISATSGPGAEYKEILLVHDGTEVSVRETRGGYALIQLPGGVGGWVPTGALEHIF